MTNIIISIAGLNKDPIYTRNLQNLMKVVLENPEFVANVKVVPEPKNPHDPKALRIDINNMSVGYIPRKEQSTLENLVPTIFSMGSVAYIDSWGVFGDDNALFCKIVIPL